MLYDLSIIVPRIDCWKEQAANPFLVLLSSLRGLCLSRKIGKMQAHHPVYFYTP
jgi:hypothetical protein